MFTNELQSSLHIKKLSKYLCKTEAKFLNRLYFWSSHKKEYGIKKDGRVWIYNTLDQWADQLGVSKSSVRRAIKSLKDKQIISSDYLSANKRNRTLYYAINSDGINEYLRQVNIVPCAQIPCVQNANIFGANEHMNEHMYNNSKQNKSYKSGKKSEQMDNGKSPTSRQLTSVEDYNSETKSETKSEAKLEILAPKPTIVQDMIRIWNEEFHQSKLELSKNLARFLVAAFKLKFNSCLKKWRKYLKTLKTSTYIMGEKFKISIWWVIKFATIDRIGAGELGVNPEKITPEKDDLLEKLNFHLESLNETKQCIELRHKIIRELSLPTYLSWFVQVNFVENKGKVMVKAPNQFVEDWIRHNFADRCGLCFD